MLAQFLQLIRKEFLLEWRQKYALNSLLLYVSSAILIVYLSFNLETQKIEPITWNTLFWLILLFSSFNAIAKGFMQEKVGRMFYYYVVVNPYLLILAKIAYNVLLMLLISLVGLGGYILFMGNPVQDLPFFLLNLVLGALGFASTLTMISAIASKANNNAVLMAILGFPVILPMLLLLIKVSKNAMDGLARSNSTEEILVLLCINAIVISVSYLLFGFLWRS
ncbi:heme exporter protein CcmB [Raineya orbicola]|uniref:CcmB protein n=1 Tax=Raineya orbicola TaxID=2016530 RepID=A0A2N3IGG3_9BACT|nr:heme exporter protein CcmB [Raineya orbicola]PKQ69333.1 CcmB protein [Raineya orbicola]